MASVNLYDVRSGQVRTDVDVGEAVTLTSMPRRLTSLRKAGRKASVVIALLRVASASRVTFAGTSMRSVEQMLKGFGKVYILRAVSSLLELTSTVMHKQTDILRSTWPARSWPTVTLASS